MMKKILAAMLMVALVIGLIACSNTTQTYNNVNNNKEKKSVPAASAIIDAKAIVQANCAVCHGQNLQGGQGPKLIGVGAEFNKNQIIDFIKNGKTDSEGSMHAGVLTDPKQINAVAEYLVNLK